MSDQIRRLNSVSKPQLWQLSDQRVSPKKSLCPRQRSEKFAFIPIECYATFCGRKNHFLYKLEGTAPNGHLPLALPNVTHDMSIANHKIWSDMLTWNTWRQLPQIKLPCEFWTELNSKSLQWTQTWRNCHHTGNISAQIHTKDANLYFWSPHAKTKACIKTNTHVCNYPRKHISRWEGGGKGRGFTHWNPACHMHAPTSLPSMFSHNIAWKESTFNPLPTSLSLLILYPRQHIMPSQGKHVDKHPFWSVPNGKNREKMQPQLVMNWQHTQMYLGLNKCRPCM